MRYLALVVTISAFILAVPLTAQSGQIYEEDLSDEPVANDPVASDPLADQPSSDELAAAQPGDLAGLEAMADRSFAEDDLKTAVALYRQAANQHQDVDEKVRVMMIVAYLEHLLGRRASGLATLVDVLVMKPQFEFQAEFYSADFSPLFYEAEKEALRLRRNNAIRMSRRGSEALTNGDLAAARQAFNESLSSWPDSPTALYNLALVDLHEGKKEQAQDGFQRVLAVAATNPDAVSSQLRGLTLTNLGSLYIDRGLNLEAEGMLAEAVELDADNRQAWYNLAICQRRLDRNAEASESARRAWTLDPGNIEATDLLSLLYIDSKNWQAAIELLSSATQQNPTHAELWLRYGLALQGRSDDNAAAHAFRSATEQDADNRTGIAATAATELAGLYNRQGEYRSALEQTEQALAWRPDLVTAWVFQGLAQQGVRDLAAAQSSLEQARQLDPTRVEVHVNLGSIYYELGKLDLAEAAYRQALAMEPGQPTATSNLEAVHQARRGGSRSTSTPSKQRQARPAPPPRRIDIGLRFSDVDYSALNLSGVMVKRVLSGSSAAKAGLEKNDLILKADGEEVRNGPDLLKRFAAGKPGQDMTLDLLRDNRPLTIRLRIP